MLNILAECHYFGHLAFERAACVAVTGCVGLEDLELTIMSSHAKGSNHFTWTKDGDVIAHSNEMLKEVSN